MKKEKICNRAVWRIYITAILAFSRILALERTACCDYVSINGDFQSYNVFRRILDGQKPYADFANYIGMAPIFTNILFVALDNTFCNSLFVTTFTSNVIFCIQVFLIFYLITGKKEVAFFASAALSKIISSKILYFLLGPKYGYILTERFTGLFTPSNSMRGTRSFLPYIIVLAGIVFKILYKKFKGENPDFILLFSDGKFISALAFICGLFWVWSNDYGTAVACAVLAMIFILNVFADKTSLYGLFKNIALFLIFFAAGAITIITVVTGADPAAYFSATMQTAQYQFFYFNGTAGKSVIGYIFSTKILLLYTAAYSVFFVAKLIFLIKGRCSDTDLFIVFIALSVFIATYIYILGGSGYNCREPFEVLAILGCMAYILKLFFFLINRYYRYVRQISAALLVGICCFYMFQLATFKQTHVGTYIPGLGGYSTLTGELIDTNDYIADNRVFSTYATGLETVSGQFQPTGYDYIIHALGKETQEGYARRFSEGDFPYAHTSALPVENWVANQNWYFYRLLLAEYSQVNKTEYGWLWKKGGAEHIDADVTVSIVQTDSGTVKIVCRSENKDEFIADVQIQFSSAFNNLTDRLLSLNRKAVLVSTTCTSSPDLVSIAFPGNSTEYIPIKMSDGYGEAVVRGGYGGGIDVHVHDAKYIGALPVLNY